MFALYPAHRTYTQWSVGPGLTQASAGTLTMVFSDSPAQAALTTAMPRYPELMASGQSFRRGGHTLTGIFDLNGIPVFGKYVDFRKKKLPKATSLTKFCRRKTSSITSAVPRGICRPSGPPRHF